MVRQITHPRSSAFSLWEQGYLAGLLDAGMSINQIREATGKQDFRCSLFFVPVVEVIENIIPGIMVGYFVGRFQGVGRSNATIWCGVELEGGCSACLLEPHFPAGMTNMKGGKLVAGVMSASV